MISAVEGLEARDNLLYLVTSWSALKARLQREGGNPLTGRVSGSGERPLVIDTYVSDLLHEIETEARSLAHALMDDTSDGPGEPWTPRTSTMPALLADVAERYGHWTAGDDRTALAFCDWAHEYAGKVRRALERPVPPQYFGDCPLTYPEGTVREGQDVGGLGCSGSLYRAGVQAEMTCRECGGVTTVEAQREFLREQLDSRILSAGEIRTALVVMGYGVPWSTVKDWTQPRGGRPPRLPEAYEQERGFYRLRDAQDLAAEWQARRAARKSSA